MILPRVNVRLCLSLALLLLVSINFYFVAFPTLAPSSRIDSDPSPCSHQLRPPLTCAPCATSSAPAPKIAAVTEGEPLHLSEDQERDAAIEILQEQLLPRLPKLEPPPNKKYHTCSFTVTRNEHHLTEFLVRNLLAGIQHMWLLDDNRVRAKPPVFFDLP